MIRKLTEKDREPLMELLIKEPALNLFIIGDVENFGFEQEFMELWGEFDTAGCQIIAVLLRFYKSYLPYAVGPFDVEGFAALLRQDKDVEMISGSSEVVKAFDSVISFRKEKHLYFAELKEMNEEIYSGLSASVSIKKATVADVNAICTLTDGIQEFENSKEGSRKSLHQTLLSGTGRTYYMERDGEVVATASTAAENSVSAMIISVATHSAYREQGLATRVVAQLSANLLAEGRSLCLFYDNPRAGTIYKRLGFRDIGFWSMMYL